MVPSLLEQSLLNLRPTISSYETVSYSPGFVQTLLAVLSRTDEIGVQEKVLKILETLIRNSSNSEIIFAHPLMVSCFMSVLLDEREGSHQSKMHVLDIFHTAVRGEQGHLIMEKLIKNCYPLVHLLGLSVVEEGKNRLLFEENIGLIEYLTKTEANLRRFVSKEVLSNGSGLRRDRTSRFIRKLVDQLFQQCLLYGRKPTYSLERSMEFIMNILEGVCLHRDLLEELLTEPQVIFLFAHISRRFEKRPSLNHHFLAQRIFSTIVANGNLPTYITDSHLYKVHVSTSLNSWKN